MEQEGKVLQVIWDLLHMSKIYSFSNASGNRQGGCKTTPRSSEFLNGN